MSLNRSSLTSAHVRNLKLARELGLFTLGQIESGYYWEQLHGGDTQIPPGNYSEQGYPEFFFEVALGDEQFETDEYDEEDDYRYDPWASNNDDDDDEEEAEQPYQTVRVRVDLLQARGVLERTDPRALGTLGAGLRTERGGRPR